MEKVTNEKSLVKVDNSIFSRIRKFCANFFYKFRNNKNKDLDYDEYEEIDIMVENNEEQPVVKTNKLFNYDAEDNMESNAESVDGDKEMNSESGINSKSTNSEVTYETVELDNQDDDSNVIYLFEKKREKSVLEEREELERKLKNYYESIKSGI